jgi:hypothetical protein
VSKTVGISPLPAEVYFRKLVAHSSRIDAGGPPSNCAVTNFIAEANNLYLPTSAEHGALKSCKHFATSLIPNPEVDTFGVEVKVLLQPAVKSFRPPAVKLPTSDLRLSQIFYAIDVKRRCQNLETCTSANFRTCAKVSTHQTFQPQDGWKYSRSRTKRSTS